MEEGKSTKLQTIAANEERYRQMHEKARREAERRIQENAKRRELQFNEMFANAQNGIDRKSGILKEVDQLVEQGQEGSGPVPVLERASLLEHPEADSGPAQRFDHRGD